MYQGQTPAASCRKAKSNAPRAVATWPIGFAIFGGLRLVSWGTKDVAGFVHDRDRSLMDSVSPRHFGEVRYEQNDVR
jgi:hypothetical protein